MHLNKNVCKMCQSTFLLDTIHETEKQNSNYKTIRISYLQKLIENFEENWSNGYSQCYMYDNFDYSCSSLVLPISINEPPPIKCPYTLEHAIS